MIGSPKEEEFKVVGITGMPGSGKGEICEMIRSTGIPVRSLGDVVRAHFASTFPKKDHREIGAHANEQRKIHGEDIWASRLVEEIDGIIEDGSELVVIDGVRSPSEVAVFRNRWGDHFSIMCVHSSPTTRFERLSSRGRGDDPESRGEFDERDSRELSWGLGDVISRADIMIINEDGMADLRESFMDIWREEIEALYRS